MRSERRFSFAALALACGCLFETRAEAFCRTTAAKAPPDYDPTASGCFARGAPLYHPSQCLPYRLLAKESPTIPNAVLSDKLARAFAAWTAPNPTCTPGISAIELAPAADATISDYAIGQRARNLVGVRADWPTGYSNDNLALTTLRFKPDTGEIIDVDLELNGTVSWSFDETPASDKFDLQSVLTHEIGHMLGLAHNGLPDTTMDARYEPGSIGPRTLAADDQLGICAIYPNRGQRLASTGLVASTPCSLAPGNADGSCSDPQITHGCLTGAARGSAPGTASLGALFGLGAVLRRRRTNRA